MHRLGCLLHFLIHANIILAWNHSMECSPRQYPPLCFCHVSSFRSSSMTDFFLARLSLFRCTNSSSSVYHCYRSQLHPFSFQLTQFLPQLTNLSHCLNARQCLKTLSSKKFCRQCQWQTHTSSSMNSSCFDFCEQNPSCGIICLKQPIITALHCHQCRARQHNLTCRCIHPISSCLGNSSQLSPPRWTQKRGFPAAVILALLMLSAALLVIAIKLIYHQLDLLDRRHSLLAQQSMTLNQTDQPSPIYFESPEMIHDRHEEFLVEIHQAVVNDENQLSILLVEKNVQI